MKIDGSDDTPVKNITLPAQEQELRPVTAPPPQTKSVAEEVKEAVTKARPKTAPAPAEKKIPMDPMRALASLEFVSARGLETSDTGPKILANHVNNSSFI